MTSTFATDRQVIARLLCAQRDFADAHMTFEVAECNRLIAKVATMGSGCLRVYEQVRLGFEPVTYWRGRFYADHEVHTIPRGMTVMSTTRLVAA